MWRLLPLTIFGIREMSGALRGAGAMAHKSSNIIYFPPYEGWRIQIFVVLAFAEVFGMYSVYRLWRKNGSESMAVKIFSSLMLLVPIVGPLLYYFVRIDPNTNPGQ